MYFKHDLILIVFAVITGVQYYLIISARGTEASVCFCNGDQFPIVRNASELAQDSYGIPGLSHITLIGAVLHGMKEVEVWIETLAPGGHTPIHKHACEEGFLVLRGSGTLFLQKTTTTTTTNDDEQQQRRASSEFPGEPRRIPIFSNATFQVPLDYVHQLWNTNEHEDLQFLVVISRPPMKAFTYDDWFTPHTAAKLLHPVFWDAQTSCPGQIYNSKPPSERNDDQEL